MKENNTSNALWAGLRELIRDVVFLEIGVFICFSLMTTGEMLP
jgi:hypothetical protein